MNVIHDFSYTNKINVEFIKNLIVRSESEAIKERELTGRYPLLFDNPTPSPKQNKNIGATIPTEVVQKFLSEYSLNQKKGIGLVAFLAEINKEKESTLLQFVFFDIKTREIISIFKYHLRASGGIGMENHWKASFSTSAYLFLKQYNEDLYFDYRKEYKRKKKRMKKLR